MTVLGVLSERCEAPLGFWREPDYEGPVAKGCGTDRGGTETSFAHRQLRIERAQLGLEPVNGDFLTEAL